MGLHFAALGYAKGIDESYAKCIIPVMPANSPFVDLIQKWPEAEGKTALETFTADLRTKYPTAAAWKQRKFIPANRWPDLIRAARQRGIDLTLEVLHAWPKPKRKRRKRAMQ
jgi:hypothetical protein